MRARLNRSAPPLPPPSGKSCGSSGSRRLRIGASISSLAVFSPLSLRAGTDAVGSSPRLARVGLVSFLGMARSVARTWARRVSDKRPIARTTLFLVAACGLGFAAVAGAPDPIHSRDCEAARARLEHALDEAAGKRAGADARLALARKQAGEACLGSDTGARVRVGAPDPAITVRPAEIEAPRTLPVAPPTPPLPAPAAPAAVTTCDPGGCWTSDGTRVNRIGSQLIGPRGACTLQAGQVQCP